LTGHKAKEARGKKAEDATASSQEHAERLDAITMGETLQRALVSNK